MHRLDDGCLHTPGQTRSFLGGRDNSLASTVRRELRKKLNLLLDGRGKPHFRKVEGDDPPIRPDHD